MLSAYSQGSGIQPGVAGAALRRTLAQEYTTNGIEW